MYNSNEAADSTMACACAVIGTFATGNPGAAHGGPYQYQVYNAYETKSTQACNTNTVGCCGGTTLTGFVQNTSTLYNCWTPIQLWNDFALQVP